VRSLWDGRLGRYSVFSPIFEHAAVRPKRVPKGNSEKGEGSDLTYGFSVNVARDQGGGVGRSERVRGGLSKIRSPPNFQDGLETRSLFFFFYVSFFFPFFPLPQPGIPKPEPPLPGSMGGELSDNDEGPLGDRKVSRGFAGTLCPLGSSLEEVRTPPTALRTSLSENLLLLPEVCRLPYARKRPSIFALFMFWSRFILDPVSFPWCHYPVLREITLLEYGFMDFSRALGLPRDL